MGKLTKQLLLRYMGIAENNVISCIEILQNKQ